MHRPSQSILPCCPCLVNLITCTRNLVCKVPSYPSLSSSHKAPDRPFTLSPSVPVRQRLQNSFSPPSAYPSSGPKALGPPVPTTTTTVLFQLPSPVTTHLLLTQGKRPSSLPSLSQLPGSSPHSNIWLPVTVLSLGSNDFIAAKPRRHHLDLMGLDHSLVESPSSLLRLHILTTFLQPF